MTFEILLVLSILAASVVLFATEKLSVDLIALLIMGALLLTGILTPEEGVSGFSNPATVTVAAMFVLSAGLFRTGAVNVVGTLLAWLGSRNLFAALISIMVIIGVISAFINNTAAVAIFMPIILRVAKEIRISPSKLLMPLSFASMFGGVCTLIGTSTNILVNSLAEQNGQPSFGMFEFSSLGLFMFAAGFVYMAVVGVRLIPDRRGNVQLTENFGMHEYLTEVVLQEEFTSIGSTLAGSPLFSDRDIDVISLTRKHGTVLAPPRPETVLHAEDTLRVRCGVEEIRKLQEEQGVVLKSDLTWGDKDLESEHVVLVEAVIAPNSVLEGKSLKRMRLRNLFAATALAIRHRGALIREKLSNTRLSAGDVLLLEVRRDHLMQLKQHPAFVIVSEVGLQEYRRSKVFPALAVIAAVVVTAALGLLPIMVSAVIGCALLILTGCITVEESYQAIEWKVIFLLGGVLPLGIALQKSGAALLLSKLILSTVGVWGPTALVAGFYLLTTLLTEAMSNNATAALLVPIAIASANSMGLDSRPLLVAITFAASSSFMTPVGYQTNTLIYGPGQYKFTDFLRVGAPLNLIFWLLATLLIPRFWSFTPV